ncbi:hypothetical protein Goarm_016956 [Gossypium armourianum]|uniref:Uncharacterized protein n=1 Tax=Gossypium armourianum TaxID=34283 RepID=A0A7J9JDU4_9ROSI|nr:hypothetical protein [Gossypium armourianum]
MTSATLPTVDLTTSANSSGSNVVLVGLQKSIVQVKPLRAPSEKEQNVFMEEDFALIEGDLLTEIVEGVPSVTFSDRVQEYIES